MIDKSFKMTISQFAKMHKINKRTLHFYDEIGLFTPKYKDENNGYRYYDYMQSIELEYIFMLKTLGMSIEQIKEYIKKPNYEDFFSIADKKIEEIDNQIHLLNKIKNNIKNKKTKLELSQKIEDNYIKIIECDEVRYSKVDFKITDNNLKELFLKIDKEIGLYSCREGVGSYISIDKVYKNNFEEYDGVFTLSEEITSSGKNLLVKPRGKYLCGYMKGDWDNISIIYSKMLDYSKKNNIRLEGYAYELSINDFAISSIDEYITQVTIKISEN